MGFTILAASLWAAMLPTAAVAQTPAPPVCAAAPEAIVPPDPLTDNDRVVRELRDGRIEAAASCAAIVDRLDTIAARTDVVRERATELRDLATGAGLHVLEQAVEEPASTTSTVALSEQDRDLSHSYATAVRADVWFLVGTLGGLFLIGWLMRPES